MLHQARIVPVVAAEIGEIVGEGLALAEPQEVAGEAGVERVALAVDDPRLGEEERDEAEAEEVARRLVGDAQRRGRMPAQMLQMLLGNAFGESSVDVGRTLRNGPLDAQPLGQRLHDPAHIVELARAVDLRVAGEDLLDQRGARARHADDEDGQLRLTSGAVHAREELGAECRDHAADVRARRVGLVQARGLLQIVAGLVVPEGGIVVARIVVDLGEGKAEGDTPIARERGKRQRALDLAALIVAPHD